MKDQLSIATNQIIDIEPSDRDLLAHPISDDALEAAGSPN